MRIVVLGGGVVGVTTAYQLQKDSHDVVVLERNNEVAAEASWGNAGMIAPGHSFVWSSPKVPMILPKSLFLEHQALRFKFSADPRLYAWSWLFLMECTSEKARRNTLLKHRRAEGACDRLSRNSGARAVRARSATPNLPARPMDAVPASTGSADGTFTVLIAHDLTYSPTVAEWPLFALTGRPESTYCGRSGPRSWTPQLVKIL